MGRRLLYDEAGANALIARQDGVITRAQARVQGITHEAIRSRISAGGAWQVLIPGVYATFTGSPTPEQRELAALLYAGPASVITGQAAMAAHGINTLGRTVVDVLIPAANRRRDHSFVHVLRTSRMPKIVYNVAELRYVPPGRAVADAARQLRDLGDVRSVLAAAVQWNRVSVADLATELEQGQTQGSAQFRAALVEIADGIRSSAEADLRTLIKHSGLPDPLYNPRLYAGDEFIATPDAWWPKAGVAVEVDSRQWHLSPADWERTMSRHSRMSAIGITVLHYSPRRLRAEPRVIVAEIGAALDIGCGRPPLPIRAVPAS